MVRDNPEKTPETTVILRASEESPSMSNCTPNEVLHFVQNDMRGVFSVLTGRAHLEENHFTQRVIQNVYINTKCSRITS